VTTSWEDAEKHSTQPERRRVADQLQCGGVRMILGSGEKGLVGQEDTKRGSERKHAEVS
jgi:hypothetical protein